MKELTPMELLDRLEWRRQLRNIMGRISHDYAVKQEAKVYERYFSRREDVCLGLNNGYYKGAAAVKGYFDALDQEIRLSSRLLQNMFPEELGEKTAEEAYGVGMISYVPFESQVIEIADDGESAKGMWNVRGSTCHLTSQGPIAKWIFGWAAAKAAISFSSASLRSGKPLGLLRDAKHWKGAAIFAFSHWNTSCCSSPWWTTEAVSWASASG